MDTEKCRVLLTVLHERSLSAAAEALGYTPSGISRLVDSLERETGFPLLHRGRGGVSATRACQELLPLMRRMAELDEQYQQLAHRIQGLDVGRVVAGTNYAAFYPWLSEVIAGFHHAYPGIRVGYNKALAKLHLAPKNCICFPTVIAETQQAIA